MSIATQALPSKATGRDHAERRTQLYGSLSDFLVLGGSSLVLLPLAVLLPEAARNPVLAITYILALAINHPHFAHSYQVFYRNYRALRATDSDVGLRRRYKIAGLVVPLFLIVFLASATLTENFRILGAAGNAMGFFVGWHYVKQGYGMLIVQGALRRIYFSSHEKNTVLANAYAIWGVTWIAVNTGASNATLFGVEYFSLNLPMALLYLAIGVTVITSMGVTLMFLRRMLRGERIPVTGVTAYLVSLYLWLIVVQIDPIWGLIVPALHSTQYMAVVWRFEMNRGRAQPDAYDKPQKGFASGLFKENHRFHFVRFYAVAFILGLLGFWIAPLALELTVSVSRADTAVFLFGFWVFINIHHYFIDSVIWRSENPEVKEYLFTEPRRNVVEAS